MLHMNTAMLAYQTLRVLWPNLADGKIPFQPELHGRAQNLRAQTAALNEEQKSALLQNLDQSILKNLNNFWDGVLRYQTHDYTRPKTKAKIIWKSGAAKLYDYGADTKNAPVVFIIPSLVNRYYILDLMPDRSFANYLRAQGFHPVILDWGNPQKREKSFDIDSYTQLMLKSFDAMRKKIKGAKPSVLGYCMGGVFALALAQNRPKDYSNLTLIATPWDFADNYAERGKIDFYIERILPQFQKLGLIPVDLIQSMFFDLDPLLVVRKFQKLGSSEPAAKQMQQFVALEDWINDGVPLAYKVLMQCMQGWYRDNLIGQNKFKVLGRNLNPKSVKKPTMLVIPKNDRIVPPKSAKALSHDLLHSNILWAETGHIGLMASSYAQKEIWPKIQNFLKKSAK